MAEFLERLAICIFATGFYFAAGARMFGVMQQCGYKNARFYAWLKRRFCFYPARSPPFVFLFWALRGQGFYP